ncbi:PspC domain-containing protein [Nocardioides gilvus]|uniref:PspC domain-containing protein n=1 Tax=Nocardioides gilvus TaxID=1735589 RepID=UPI0013A53AD0|nr:PspC domain-containing protein [Nocardioides gilvus]
MDETTHSTSGPAGEPGAPSPGPGPDPQSGARTDWDQVKDIGGLQRPADRKVAGVAAGLARHLNIDPLVLRVAFVVLSFFGGAGIIVYGALWLLLPEDGQPQAPVPLDVRSRTVAVVGVVALAALALVGDTWGWYRFPWALVVIGLVLWLLWSRRDASTASPAAAPTAPYAPAYDPAAPTAPYAPYAPEYAPAYAPAYDPAGPTAPYTQPHWTQQGAVQAPLAQTPLAQTPPVQPPLARPRDPRRRGPVLFWFTLALIALALGVLGTLDLAGVAVADSAYPALAMTIAAAVLVLGAFWGRAGGVILIALVAAVTTVGAMAAEHSNEVELFFTPGSASEVRDSYEIHRGELVLDLTEVSDPAALDDREIRVDGGAGRVEIRLPEGLGYDIEAAIGVGSIRLPDQDENGGLGISASAGSEPSESAPRIDIVTDMGVGEIVVTQP